MKQKNIYKTWYRFVASAILTLLLMTTFAYVWYTQFNILLIKEFLLKGNYFVIAVYGVIAAYFIGFLISQKIP